MLNRRGGSSEEIKRSIERIVSSYTILHPEDYKLTKKAVQMKRELLKDPKFAQTEGDMRAIFEVSEVLSEQLILGLDATALAWFKTKDGGRWFANKYPEFRIPDLI